MLVCQLGTEIPGLKDDPIPPYNSGSSGGIGATSLVQMLVALAVVVVLIRWLVPKYLKKVSFKSKHVTGVADVEVVGSTIVGGSSVHLIKVRGRTLLIGSSAQGLSTLADLTEETGTFHLPSPLADQQASSGSFEDVLTRLGRLSGEDK